MNCDLFHQIEQTKRLKNIENENMHFCKPTSYINEVDKKINIKLDDSLPTLSKKNFKDAKNVKNSFSIKKILEMPFSILIKPLLRLFILNMALGANRESDAKRKDNNFYTIIANYQMKDQNNEIQDVRNRPWLTFTSEAIHINTSDVDSGKEHQLEGFFFSAKNPKQEGKRTILLCSGSHQSFHHQVFPVILALTKLGHDVVAFNPSGFGQSQGIASEEQLYMDAYSALKYIQEEKGVSKENLVGYGYSLGGAVIAGVADELGKKGFKLPIILDRTFSDAPEAARSKVPFIAKRIAHAVTGNFLKMNTKERLTRLHENSILAIKAGKDTLPSIVDHMDRNNRNFMIHEEPSANHFSNDLLHGEPNENTSWLFKENGINAITQFLTFSSKTI